MKRLARFAPLAAGYDGLILDLWGVIHDGVRLYPGAAECLQALRNAGKRVVFLSNAPRRAGEVQAQLRCLGIPDNLYDGVMTSGEATHLMLRDRSASQSDPWYAALRGAVFHLGPKRDRNVLDGLGLSVLDAPDGAGFVLNTGPDDRAKLTDPAAYDHVLRDCAARKLPMICANPDLWVIRGGTRVVCAGLLAQRFADMGGDVRSLGKPDPAIYAPVLAMLGLPKRRVLAVGDALRTDIAGAAAVGIDACWVLGGLHGAHEGSDTALEAEAAAAGLSPLAAIPHFVW